VFALVLSTLLLRHLKKEQTNHDSVVVHKKAFIVDPLPCRVPSAYVVVEVSVGEHFFTGWTTIKTWWHVHLLKVPSSVALDSLSTKKTDETGWALFDLRLH
jgi:hypothetical protein